MKLYFIFDKNLPFSKVTNDILYKTLGVLVYSIYSNFLIRKLFLQTLVKFLEKISGK